MYTYSFYLLTFAPICGAKFYSIVQLHILVKMNISYSLWIKMGAFLLKNYFIFG